MRLPHPWVLATVAIPFLASACAPSPQLSAPSRPQEPAESGFLVVGARVVDGTGAPALPAAVRVRGDRIADVGALTPEPGERVVDGHGLVLAPGFIDTHSHADDALMRLPDALGAVSQGVTTVVVGQDGGSPYPLADFFDGVERTGVAVNVAAYAGHGTLRERVMGKDFRREATPAEVDSMRALLRREMAAGALGLSTGLEYDPGIYSTTEEVVALAREAGAAGGRYISHMRSEDRRLFEAVDELIRIGREAHVPVQISHMKLAMKSLWGRADALLARLDSARAEGVDVTADVYPYTYWQSTMTVLFPDRNFTDRAAATFALDELVPPEGMRIARYQPEPGYEGHTLAEVAATRGEDPVTTYMALIERVEREKGDESIIATSMDAGDVARLLQWRHANVGSDGGLDGAHPRGFGSFTRVLGPMVRDGTLTLEEAVHKMTALSAAHVGIQGRGVIRPGAFADLVLFDPATVRDRATPDAPHALSDGIARVWVNGRSVYERGATTGARPGRVVRRPTSPVASADRVHAAALAGPADGMAAAPAAARLASAVDAVFADYDSRRSPGCAVGVIEGDSLAFARGYGMADLEHAVQLSPSSVFRVGSVSKQFTAAAIVLLAQDGSLSLEGPVREYLPELPDFGPRFTVRALLNHTSGVRDYLTLMTLAGHRDQDWYSDDDVMAMLARQKAPNFDPGSEHLYSNSGYFLLSQLVRRVTGETLAEFARRRIFAPLGMRQTRYQDDPTSIVPDRAMGYAPADDEGYRISMTTLPMVGDGGIFTSIRDLVAWDANLDAGATVGGPAFAAEMVRRGVLSSGDTLDYALGLEHGAQRGLHTVSHGGAFVGFRAASLRYPEQDVSVYTLCNRADADPMERSLRVGEAVLGDRMGPEAPTDDRSRGARDRPRVDTVRVAPDALGAFAGRYHSDELAADYRVRLQRGSLMLEVGNELDGRMAATGGDTFRRGPLVLRFFRTAGEPAGFDVDAGRVRGIRFRRVTP